MLDRFGNRMARDIPCSYEERTREAIRTWGVVPLQREDSRFDLLHIRAFNQRGSDLEILSCWLDKTIFPPDLDERTELYLRSERLPDGEFEQGLQSNFH